MNAHHIVTRIALALVAVWLFAGPSAHAEPPAPLALTISGGGTKGAYMGGHLYYMGEMTRRTGAFEPKVFTGASAGAINSFIGAISTCQPAALNPRETLYWHAWTSVGVGTLVKPDAMTGTGIFSVDAYRPVLDRARLIWDAGLPESCDLLVGVAVTRATARQVRLAADFPRLPLSREIIVVRITGQGAGRPPKLTNYIDSHRPVDQLLLPLDGPDARPFDGLVSVVLASAAFPVGFSPVVIPHCRGADGPTCTPSQAREAHFVDGGTFDNQPLGTAVQAMRGLAQGDDGRPVIAATPGDAVPANARFYFLDPRVRTWPRLTRRTAEDTPEDILDVLGILAGMVDSSFARELIAAIEKTPDVRERLLLARTWFPQISGTFNGLLDESFRSFDFYLGMYNAARTVRQEGLTDPVEAAALADASPAMQAAWRPFRCLRAVLDGVGDPAICDDPALLDFRILLQVTLDQLHDNCRQLGERKVPPPEDHPQCAAAMRGDPPPQVVGVEALPVEERQRRPRESVLRYQIRLLGRYGLHFRDLGLDRDESEHAYDQVIRLAGRVLQRFADVQPRSRWAMGVLTRMGVDVGVGYLPPVHSAYVAFGLGNEIGYSMTRDRRGWNWFRLSLALGLDGLSSYLDPSTDYLAFIPKAGFEAEVYGSGAAQVRLGVRAGYQLSTGDAFGTGDCERDREGELPCSRLVTEAFGAVSLLGLVRLQLAGLYRPPVEAGQAGLFSLRPTLGIQFNSPF